MMLDVSRNAANLANRLTYLGVDYDKTLSKCDTCEAIASAAMCGRPDETSARMRWDVLVAELETESMELPSFLPQEPQSFSSLSLHKWLEKQAAWDARANDRLEASGVLAGASRDDLQRLGESVELQSGAMEVIGELLCNCRNGKVTVGELSRPKSPIVEVVSASWSSEVLEASMAKALQTIVGVQQLPIFANSMLPGDSLQSDGSLRWRVRSAMDKAKLVAERRDSLGPPVAFIGDSTGDLGAMMEADLAIAIGFSSSLRQAATKLGVSNHSVLALAERCTVEACDPWEHDGKALYWAGSWAEVGRLFFG